MYQHLSSSVDHGIHFSTSGKDRYLLLSLLPGCTCFISLPEFFFGQTIPKCHLFSTSLEFLRDFVLLYEGIPGSLGTFRLRFVARVTDLSKCIRTLCSGDICAVNELHARLIQRSCLRARCNCVSKRCVKEALKDFLSAPSSSKWEFHTTPAVTINIYREQASC